MTRDPEEAQRKLLRRIVRANRGTAFGRRHGFDQIRTVEDYQSKLPIADYEAFRPWVDRMRKGEANVLTVEAPHTFTTTSGTTGEPKFIPVNDWTRRSGARLSAMWLYRSLVDHPRLLDGKALVTLRHSQK